MRDGVEVSTPSFEMTWGSTTSSGYCSQEDSDSEFEQYFTARTSFFRKPRKDIGKHCSWNTIVSLLVLLSHICSCNWKRTRLPFPSGLIQATCRTVCCLLIIMD
ncbi:UNVERIFIED_CONTAM: hypothetical protein FKN15_024397 [Acipenser sinensis]